MTTTMPPRKAPKTKVAAATDKKPSSPKPAAKKATDRFLVNPGELTETLRRLKPFAAAGGNAPGLVGYQVHGDGQRITITATDRYILGVDRLQSARPVTEGAGLPVFDVFIPLGQVAVLLANLALAPHYADIKAIVIHGHELHFDRLTVGEDIDPSFIPRTSGGGHISTMLHRVDLDPAEPVLSIDVNPKMLAKFYRISPHMRLRVARGSGGKKIVVASVGRFAGMLMPLPDGTPWAERVTAIVGEQATR